MDVLPTEVRATLARFPLGSQEGRGVDALVVVKYFFPAGRYTLYVTEAEFDGDDAQLFGYCISPFGKESDEWGYASLAELRGTPRPRPHDRARPSLPDRDTHRQRSAEAHARRVAHAHGDASTPTARKENPYMDIVLKLRELRRLRGLSQKDVARLSGVGEKTISSFETGERVGSLKLAQLAKLLVIYGVTEEQFFSRAIEELFDPDAISRRSREEQLIAGLTELPTAARNALLERFELMLDSALTVSVPTSETIRLRERRSAAPVRHASAA